MPIIQRFFLYHNYSTFKPNLQPIYKRKARKQAFFSSFGLFAVNCNIVSGSCLLNFDKLYYFGVLIAPFRLLFFKSSLYILDFLVIVECWIVVI